jgi:hypothetical protein
VNTAENNNVEYQKKRSTPRKYPEKKKFNIIQKMWWNLSNYKKNMILHFLGQYQQDGFQRKQYFHQNAILQM